MIKSKLLCTLILTMLGIVMQAQTSFIPVDANNRLYDAQVAVVKNAGVDVGYVVYYHDKDANNAPIKIKAKFYDLSHTLVGGEQEPFGNVVFDESSSLELWSVESDNALGIVVSVQKGGVPVVGYHTVNPTTGTITEVANERAATGFSGAAGSSKAAILNNGNIVFIYSYSNSSNNNIIAFDIINPLTNTLVVGNTIVENSALTPNVEVLEDASFVITYSKNLFSDHYIKRYSGSGTLLSNPALIITNARVKVNVEVLNDGRIAFVAGDRARFITYLSNFASMSSIVNLSVPALSASIPSFNRQFTTTALASGGFALGFLDTDGSGSTDLLYQTFDDTGIETSSGATNITPQTALTILDDPHFATLRNGTVLASFGNLAHTGTNSDPSTQLAIVAPANFLPTAITLSSNIIFDSSTGNNATVATLSTSDDDPGDTFTYSLVAGDGDNDNGLFNINGNMLRTNSLIPAGSYSIRVNTNDGTNDFAQAITITVTTPVTAPTYSFENYIYTTGNNQSTGLTNLLGGEPGATFTLYDASSGGNVVTSLIDDTLVYATQTLNGLESLARIKIPVNEICAPTQSLPVGSTVADLATNLPASQTASWYDMQSGGTPLVDTDVLNTGQYFVEQDNTEIVTTAIGGMAAPVKVEFDSQGRFFVFNAFSRRVTRYDADGSNPVNIGGLFNENYSLAIDSQDRILLAEFAGTNIVRMDADGNNLTILPVATSTIVDIKVDHLDRIYFVSLFDGTVKRMNPDGTNITTLGTFNSPESIAIDPQNRVLVGSRGDSSLYRISADLSSVSLLATGIITPYGIVVDNSGFIYVSEVTTNTVKRMEADGSNVVAIGNGFNFPQGLAVDNQNNLLIADTGNNAVKRVTSLGRSNRVAVQVNILFPSVGLQLNATDTYFKIDFDNTVANVNNGPYAGTGLSATPVLGQLDTQTFTITGINDPSALTRGASTGGVTTGGLYSFDVSNGGAIDRALGIQPGGSDFTPGSIALRFQNRTGAPITDLSVFYEIYVNNDQERASSIVFEHGSDPMSTTVLNDTEFITPPAAGIFSGRWRRTLVYLKLENLNIPDGSAYYLKWTGNDESGSGSRDEYGLDNISISAQTGFFTPPPFQSDYENLIIASNLNLQTPLNLEGKLYIRDALFSSNGNLTFKSKPFTNSSTMTTEIRTAVLQEVTGSAGFLEGDVTVEQYFPANRAFRFISTPVSGIFPNGSVYENWQEGGNTTSGFGTHITGGLASDKFDQSITNSPSLFTYNEAANGGNGSWEAFSSANGNATDQEPLFNGKAYRLFIRGDRNVSLTSTNAAASSTILRSTGEMNFDGSVVSGSQNFGNDGTFAFIGNPLQAQIDLSQTFNSFNSEDILTTRYYAWVPALENYVTYEFSGAAIQNGVSKALQPGQAFFVQTDQASGTTPGYAPRLIFSLDQSVGEVTNTATLSQQQASYSIRLYDSELLNGPIANDFVRGRLNAGYNNAIDIQDAPKFSGSREQLAITNGGERLSIEYRDMYADNEILSLFIDQLEDGNYTFDFNFVGFNGYNIYLEDSYTGQTTLIDQTRNYQYAFSVNLSLPSTFANDRFSIRFEVVTLGVDDSAFAKALQLYPNPVIGDQLFVSGMESKANTQVSIMNLLGQLVLNPITELTNQNIIVNGLEDLMPGIYLLTLQDNKGMVRTIKFIKE